MELIYGIHAVNSLLRNNPRQVQCLRVRADRENQRLSALLNLARNQGVATLRCSREELDDLVSGRHQGVVAEVLAEALTETPRWHEQALYERLETLAHPALILVLDGVTDPHNLGACLRSADAAGVDAVVVPRDKSAPLTATVRKVACGAAETVPLVRVTNLARTLAGLKESGLWLYGAVGEAQACVYDTDLTAPCALIVGAEGAGLRRLTRDRCDTLVALPMAGSVNSLNVSVAAGICLFEAVRQRRSSKQRRSAR